MATVTSLQNDVLPQHDTDIDDLKKVVALTNGIAANGDQINVWKVPIGSKYRLLNAILNVSATLGAGATIQGRVNRSGVFTVITAASTAAAASKVDSAAQLGVPMDLVGGDIVELLVGGANITAAATATIDLILAPQA